MRPCWIRFDDGGHDEYELVDADVGLSLGRVVQRDAGWFVADPWMPDQTFIELGAAMDVVERVHSGDSSLTWRPGGARPDP